MLFLLGGLAVGGGGWAFWRNRAPPLAIPEAARRQSPAALPLPEPPRTEGVGGQQSSTVVRRVCSVGAPDENTAARTRVEQAVRESELLAGESSDSDADSEEELIAGGRPSSTLQQGHSSIARDTIRAAWLFEERPSLPQNAPVMQMLPSSASTHLYVVSESALGWMYVFEKWRDGVCAARFRNPDHARRYRAGFMGRFRKRKQVRQITSVEHPTSPDGEALRVSDLLVWSAEHTEFRQLTDNCHTYAANLAVHLGMQTPAGWWEQVLYDNY
eukprot:TRINITY_DN1976_c0_g1_i1.p1 TRINITY_DN1976_c0_g1~~TRINITY_DN1976_c0_g1_i1.p1  ORF type:complete len:272 (+),score=72.76 TRINITY_DN1976_c0_g1_i1:151-966(+)